MYRCVHRLSVRARCATGGLDEPDWRRAKVVMIMIMLIMMLIVIIVILILMIMIIIILTT